MRHLQIIGEAARSLPDDVRCEAPDIERTKIVGMRHVLGHGYFDIDVDIVWDTASRDLVPLQSKVEDLVERMEQARRHR